MAVIQWNLDLTKCQGTGEIGFVILRFIISGVLFNTFYYYWAEECGFFIPRTSLYRGSLNRGSILIVYNISFNGKQGGELHQLSILCAFLYISLSTGSENLLKDNSPWVIIYVILKICTCCSALNGMAYLSFWIN